MTDRTDWQHDGGGSSGHSTAPTSPTTTNPVAPLRPLAIAYLGALVLAAVGMAIVLAARGPGLGVREAVLAAALVGLLAAAYRRPLSFGPHTHLLLDTAPLLGAALLLPSGFAIPVALAGPLLANLPRREPWSQAVFNGGQAAIQVACASLALGIAGWSRVAPFDDYRFLLAVPIAGMMMYLVNTSAVAAILALQEGETFLRVWRRLALLNRTEATGHGAQWGLALLAVIVADGHPWGLILLGLPGIVVFVALDHNTRLRLRAEERLVHQAFHDSLTGLPNRARLVELLDGAVMDGHDRNGLAVLFLDLDQFKLINDTLGHKAGDDLLIEAAARLRACIRHGHTVGRLGGDEFVVIMDGITDVAEPQHVANCIVDALTCRPVTLAGHNIFVGASIGIAVAGPEHRTGSDLLRDADSALYRAKEAGRGRIMLFDQAMGWAVRDRLAKETDWLTAAFAPVAKVDTRRHRRDSQSGLPTALRSAANPVLLPDGTGEPLSSEDNQQLSSDHYRVGPRPQFSLTASLEPKRPLT